jgi:hypothetical protein
VPEEITPEHLAYRRAKIQEERMSLYKQRFEEHVSTQDLWAYISNKIAHEGENVFKVPTAGSRQTTQFVESQEIAHLRKDLERILTDEQAPSDEKAQAETMLHMLKVRPL